VTLLRGTALALGLVAVFTVITVSVVAARDAIDSAVTRSFEETAPRLKSFGCRERSLNTYDCYAFLRPAGPSVRYRLLLRDDGCWTARDDSVQPDPTVPFEVKGCLAE
jgi:hypothetical protein